MKLNYIFSINDDETGDIIFHSETLSLEHHQEELSKAEQAVEKYQTGQKEFLEEETLCGNPGNHNGGDTDGCAECLVLKHNL